MSPMFVISPDIPWFDPQEQKGACLPVHSKLQGSFQRWRSVSSCRIRGESWSGQDSDLCFADASCSAEAHAQNGNCVKGNNIPVVRKKEKFS